MLGPSAQELLGFADQFEIDTDGRAWRVLPYEVMNDSFVCMTDWLERPLIDGVAQASAGIRLRLSAEQGHGHWDVIRISGNLTLYIGSVEYIRPTVLHVRDRGMAKIRIMLSGRLRSLYSEVAINDVGAFIEVFPGDLGSTYELAGGQRTEILILQCYPRFFTDDLGVNVDDLMPPLTSLFDHAGPGPEGDTAPVGVDVLRAANDIMRGASRYAPHLRTPFYAAKCHEIACSVLHHLAPAARHNAFLNNFSVRDVGRAHEARDILLANFVQPLTIARLAKAVGVNQTKLKAVFKATFGITIYQFIQNCRMERAIDLLRGGDMTIAQIGYAVGYQHPANFSSAFKRHHGQKPRHLKHAAANVCATR